MTININAGPDQQHWTIVVSNGRTHSIAGSRITCIALHVELAARAAADKLLDPAETDERSLFRWLHNESEANLPPLGAQQGGGASVR